MYFKRKEMQIDHEKPCFLLWHSLFKVVDAKLNYGCLNIFQGNLNNKSMSIKRFSCILFRNSDCSLF
jgi:hypothetical protein